jgi:hypothetical protein
MSDVAVARPQFLLPTQTIPLPAQFYANDVAISGDWMVIGGSYDADDDPNSYIALNRVFVYHRAANGTWPSGTLLFAEQSPEYFTKVAINSHIIVVEVASGTHIFENTASGWVERPVDGAAASFASPYLDIDGTTVLLGDGSCGSNAVVLDRTSAGHWAKSGELLGTPKPCSDSHVGNQHVAVSGNTGIVWDALADRDNHARVFERAPGPTWTHTAVLQRPPLDEPDYYFGDAFDLSGSLALVSGWNRGTNVYRRSGSTWSRTGFLTYLDGFTQLASRLHIGDQYIVQSGYNSTVDFQLLHVFRERADQGFDEVAQLATPDGTPIGTEFDISGSRVVAATWEKVFFYQLPEPLNLVPATQQYDFETGSTAQWTILPGSNFSVAISGGTHVYRQSSTAGDAGATHPDDHTTQAIQADITPAAFNGTDRWVGLVTRYTDESNYYYVTLRNTGSGVVVLKRKLDGVITELARTVVGVAVNEQRRVRLESDGNRHSVLIDDYEYLHAYDDALPHGRAGLRTYRASANFDNVLVSAAPRAQFMREEINQTSAAFDPVDGQWAIEHDELFDQDVYRQNSVAGDARSVAWPVSDDQIVQTWVRVEALAPAPRGEAWVGLMARYRDPSNYYYVTLRSSNQISLRRLVNGQATVLRSAALPVAVGDDFLVRLDVVGNKLRVYVDRALLFEAMDSTFAAGKTGLVTYRAAARFGAFSAYHP